MVVFCYSNKGNWKWLLVALGFPAGIALVSGLNIFFTEVVEKIVPLNSIEIFSILVGMVLIILLIIFNNKNKIYPIVNFNPPSAINSAISGYIYDQNLNDKDLNSLVVYLYSKKYVNFEKKHGQIYLVRNRECVVAQDDRNILDSIIPETWNEVSMYIAMKHARSLKRQLIKDNYTKYFDTQKRTKGVWVSLVSSILLICIAWSIAFRLGEERGQGAWLGIILTIIIPILQEAFITKAYKISLKLKPRELVIFLLIILALPGMILGPLLLVFETSLMNLIIIAVEGPLLLIVFVFTILKLRNFSIRNDEGEKIYSELLGLRDFLEKVEKDKFGVMCENNPHYLRELTPYIYLFDLNDKFFKRLDIDISKYDIDIDIEIIDNITII